MYCVPVFVRVQSVFVAEELPMPTSSVPAFRWPTAQHVCFAPQLCTCMQPWEPLEEGVSSKSYWLLSAPGRPSLLVPL